jgi:hypothetical protein
VILGILQIDFSFWGDSADEHFFLGHYMVTPLGHKVGGLDLPIAFIYLFKKKKKHFGNFTPFNIKF